MKKSIIASAMLLATLAGAAQSHPSKPATGTVTVINNDTVSGAKVYKEMAEIAPQSPNIPNAPRFALVGKDGKFYLGIGGSIKGTVSYDFGDPLNNSNEFVTSQINMNPTPGNNGLVQFSGQQSNLFVNFVAMPGTKDKVGVFISGNFLGSGYGFQLQWAYAKWRGFTVGYDFSLFTDAAAAPPTIDYEGPNALTAIPNGVLDYRANLSKKVQMGVGVELPQASYTTNASTYAVNQRVPDIPAYLQYSWGGGSSWIRLSGILRNMAYRDAKADKTENVVGYGVKLSGSASLCPAVTAYYQGAYGKGMTSYFQDLNGAGLDLTPSTETGKLDAVEAWGAYGGLQFNLSPKAFATATYSHVRDYAKPYEGGSTAYADQYKYAQYFVTNFFYNVNPMVQVGAEYIWGRKVDFSGASHHDNRIQAMLQVSF